MKKYIVFVLLAVVFSSCEDFLANNPDNSFTTFESVDEVQALLDNFEEMNEQYRAHTEYGADTYYLTTDNWNNLIFPFHPRYYLWQGVDDDISPWQLPYRTILNANVALDELSKLSRNSNPQGWDNAKGSALFFRTFYFLNLSQLYIRPYDIETADTDLGLPLRLDPDPEVPSVRSSVQETYERILIDFREAASLLSDSRITTARPSKAAAYGALARTFLAMGQYDSARVNADRALQIKGDLIDYNTLDSTATAPIPQFNEEELFYAVSSSDFLLNPFFAKVDTTLYASYEDNDLRRSIFFTENSYAPGRQAFTGDYSGLSDGSSSAYVYGGIATDELYLIRAEGRARTGDVSGAMDDLNTLLETRWKDGTFTPYTASDQTDATRQIIEERRKELLFRGHRWTDIRRLRGTEFAITPKRVIESQEYVLSPGNPETRYTLLIPSEVIELSGMQQNE